MPSVRQHRVFYVPLPDGKRAHRIAAAAYTYAVVTRVDVLWTVEAMSTSRKQAEKHASRWRMQMMTSLHRTKAYEARVVPVTCEDLPPGCCVRATLPGGNVLKSRYWPILGERRPRWVVVASAKQGWKACAWPADDLEASMALTRARQDYPGVAPQLIPVNGVEQQGL